MDDKVYAILAMLALMFSIEVICCIVANGGYENIVSAFFGFTSCVAFLTLLDWYNN